MAIAIPIIMAYAGTATAVSAAIGLTAAVGATVGSAIVSIGVGAALQASGINDKINKAASKVFGEDVVKVANIAGTIFLASQAFTGGADGAAGAESAVPDGSTVAPPTDVPTPDVMGPPADLAGAAPSVGDAAGAAGGSMGPPIEASSGYMGPPPEAAGGGGALANPNGPVSPGLQQPAQPSPMSQPPAGQAANAATSANSTASNPALIESQVGTPGYGASSVNAAAPGGGGSDSFLSKLLASDQGRATALQVGGNLLQGALGGYSQSLAAREMNRPSADSGYTGAGYRPYDDRLARRRRPITGGTGG
ncbi:MAG: hypothetical protein HY856_13580 [Burkholderiales bacterium]|nr:hypothetical protein [Burkholderiales bacterium]